MGTERVELVMPSGLDEEAATSKRDQILLEAEKLFAEKGYRETNLDEVAARLGFRRQAIYHYFGSKDEILGELIHRAGHTLDVSAEATFGRDLRPTMKIMALVRNHIRQVLRYSAVFRVQFEELGKMTDPRAQALRESRDHYVHQFSAIIAQGQQLGEFTKTSPTTQALLIIGMCNWTIEWFGPGTQMTVDEVVELAARTAVRALQAPVQLARS